MRDVLELADGDAHVDARAAPVEAARLVTCILNGDSRRLDEESVLRIHHVDSSRGDAEVQRRELANVFDERATGSPSLVHVALVLREEGVVVPAILRYLRERDLALANVLPELGGVLRLGEAAADSDDCDGFLGRRHHGLLGRREMECSGRMRDLRARALGVSTVQSDSFDSERRESGNIDLVLELAGVEAGREHAGLECSSERFDLAESIRRRGLELRPDGAREKIRERAVVAGDEAEERVERRIFTGSRVASRLLGGEEQRARSEGQLDSEGPDRALPVRVRSLFGA